MLFRLLPKTGPHTERVDGVDYTYAAGDVIESDEDLVEKFQNKFVRLDPDLPNPTVPQPTIPIPHRFIKDETIVSKSKDEKVAGVNAALDSDSEMGRS